MRYLKVQWHDLRLEQKNIDEKDDSGNLRHRYVLRQVQVLTRYFTLRLTITVLEVMRVLLVVGRKVDINL
jgi:hypothetical protein